MPLSNDQLQPIDPLQQALLMAQMGQPTAPSHNPGEVQAAMIQALMQQRRADDMYQRPPRRMEQMGWGSALTELARPFVAKRNEKKANEELAKAMGKQGDLDRYDAALAEYQAGIKDAQKNINDLTVYESKKQVDQRYEKPEKPEALPEKAQLIEWLRKQPPETQAMYANYLGLTEKADKPSLGTVNIGGKVVPTIDGVPQMGQDYGPTEAGQIRDEKKEAADKQIESGREFLSNNMGNFAELLTNPNFDTSVGPADAAGLTRWFGDVANTKDSQQLRKIDRLTGTEVLELGARVLKGSQTEGEWKRIAQTMPTAKDHPEVWYTWFDDTIKGLIAKDPKLLDTLEPLRQKIYQHADENLGGWERKGQYQPYSPSGQKKVGKYTIVEEG